LGVHTDTIEALLVRTRGKLLGLLETAVLCGGTLTFANEMLDHGFVRLSIDAEGGDVFIPVQSDRMRLGDRVSALIASDYLNAPEAYAALYVCHRCEAVVFDEGAHRQRKCSARRRSRAMTSAPRPPSRAS
jgi:hypothetical protein